MSALALQELLIVACWLVFAENCLWLSVLVCGLDEERILRCVFGSSKESLSWVFVSHGILDGVLHDVLGVSS